MVGSSTSVVQAANEYFDALVKSRFIEMFGSNEKVPLTELASITMGQSPDSSSYNNESRGVPFFQGKTEFGDTFVSVNLYCDAPKKMAKSMDILMSVRAPVGSVNITPVDCCIGRGLAAISPISNVTNVWFLYHALRLMEKEIESMGVGSTFKAINKSNMNEIKVPLASMELQNQFADFVRQVDKSKLLFQQVVSKYDELVKSRFIEMFGNDTSNYPEVTIYDMLSNVSGGGTPSKSHPEYYGGDIPWVTSKDVKQFYIDDSEIHITEEGLNNSSAKMIPANSIILVVRSGILKHTLPVSVSTRPVSINQDLKGLEVKSDVNPIYLAYALKRMETKIIGESRATTVDNVEIKRILNFLIPKPPYEIQNQFADFVRQVDKSKSEILESIKRLKSNRITEQ